MIGTGAAGLALGWLLVAGAPAGGDEPPAAPLLSERIEVVGTADDDAAEAARRSTLGRAELRLLPAETLAEGLFALPGVVLLFASPFGGSPMAVMRGFFGGGEVDYLGLEVDGVPLAATETGVVDWRSVRLEEVERLDLLAGPAMRRGGVDPALAGLLRVTTRPPGSPPRLTARLALASFDTATVGVVASGGRGAWNGLATLDGATTGGYREHSESDEAGVALRLDRPLGAGFLGLSVRARGRARDEPGPLSELELADDSLASNGLFAEDREHLRAWAATVRWAGRAGAVPVEGHLAADGRRSRFRRTLLIAEGFGDRALREVEAGSLAGRLSTPGEIALGPRSGLRLAFDFRSERADTRYELESGAPPALDEAERQRVVAEAGLALRPHARLEVDLSLRGDRVDDRSRLVGSARHEAWSPRLGVVWAVTGDGERGLDLFGEVGRAFKAPTLDQLYDPRPFAGPEGEILLSNPGLEPQRSRGWELGARGRLPRFDGRLVAYRLIVENEIDFDPASFRYANIGRSRHEGIEASAQIDGAPAGQFRLVLAHSIAEAEGERPTGQLKNIPVWVVRLGWSRRVGSFEVGWWQSFLGGRWADDLQTRALEDVHRTDLRLAREMNGLRFTLDLLNAFDDDALEVAYLLPSADSSSEVLHGFAPAPRALRLGVERSW